MPAEWQADPPAPSEPRKGEHPLNCWVCDRPGSGCCTFCGRAICKEHVQEVPNIIALYQAAGGGKKALTVPDALYCGVCHPKGDPVDLPGLD